MEEPVADKTKKYSLCSGGGCCPDLTIKDDGSVELEEHGVKLSISKSAADLLASYLQQNGYGG